MLWGALARVGVDDWGAPTRDGRPADAMVRAPATCRADGLGKSGGREGGAIDVG